MALIARWISEGANWPANRPRVSRPGRSLGLAKAEKAPLPNVRTRGLAAPIARSICARATGASRARAGARGGPLYAGATRVFGSYRAAADSGRSRCVRERPGGRALTSGWSIALLADPAYGERWARVWLDLARYADTKGYGSDPLRTIWRYRDWVIEAFNRNLPYDQFTIEQLAGDLLPDPTADQILATAFHRNTMANDEGGTDDEEFRVAAVKDRIETTMQVWMGLTMGCAKCHSHKFDPITQREYYQAYALFNQTEDADRGDEAPLVPTPTA